MFGRDAAATVADVRALLAGIVDEFALELTAHATATRRRELPLTSKFDHCLSDLLYRARGELRMETAGVVSNHPRRAFQHFDFHYAACPSAHPLGMRGRAGSAAADVIETSGIELACSHATYRSCRTISPRGLWGDASKCTTGF